MELTGIITALKAIWAWREFITVCLLAGCLVLAQHKIAEQKTTITTQATTVAAQAGKITALNAVAAAKESAINAAVVRERALVAGRAQLLGEIQNAPKIEDDTVAPIGKRAFDSLRRLEGGGTAINGTGSRHT